MKCLTNVRIILPDRILDDHAIVFDETIHAIIPNSQLPADAQLLADCRAVITKNPSSSTGRSAEDHALWLALWQG